MLLSIDDFGTDPAHSFHFFKDFRKSSWLGDFKDNRIQPMIYVKAVLEILKTPGLFRVFSHALCQDAYHIFHEVPGINNPSPILETFAYIIGVDFRTPQIL